MPRIRKKTSRRGTTHQREKIKHKATESRKKAKKEAKRNPQWKSKNPKDPGIPNNFPFKDQVLAEIAEERRKAEEAKAARKEAKKSAKAASKAKAVDNDAEAGQSDEEAIVDGLATTTIQSSRLKMASKVREKAQATITEDESTAGEPNPDFPHLQSVLDVSDVVIQVLDARDPLSYISPTVEEVASNKKTIYVLNKIDTCPRESLSAWAAHLRRSHPTVYFRAAARFLPPVDNANLQASAKLPADDALGAKAVMSLLTHWAADQPEGKPLTVAIMGATNVGKSAFINSLARKPASTIYQTPSVGAPSNTPTTTLYPIEVTIGASQYQIRLIDTPGVTFITNPDMEPEIAEAFRAHDILVRSKGRIDRMKNPTPCITQIVARANQQDLMLFYNLPAYAKDSVDALLATIARTQKLTKKGGELDLAAASRLILRDWATNKLPRYTIPPKISEQEPVPPTASEVHLDDEKTLAQIPTRTERRKASGVVRLIAATAESRRFDLQAPWASEAFVAEARDDAAEQENEVDGMDTEEEGEEENAENDDEIDIEVSDDEDHGDDIHMPSPELPLVSKGKRKSTTNAIPPPSKRVQFSRVTVTQTISKTKTAHDADTMAVPKSALKPAKPLPTSTTKTKPKDSKLKAKAGGTKLSVADARKVQRVSGINGGKNGKKAGLKSTNAGEDGAYNFGEFF